jgi:hypothetical protein
MDTKNKLMWEVIESFEWDENGDYNLKILDFWQDSVLLEAQTYTKDLRKHLQNRMGEHAERMTGDQYGYYGVSDDGFWDLTAHIVGLGENVYHLVLKYPEIAKMMADRVDYCENFEYVFHDIVKD